MLRKQYALIAHTCVTFKNLGLEGIADLKVLPSTLALGHNMISDSKQQLQRIRIKACTEACKSVHFLGTTHLRSDVPRKRMVSDDHCVMTD